MFKNGKYDVKICIQNTSNIYDHSFLSRDLDAVATCLLNVTAHCEGGDDSDPFDFDEPIIPVEPETPARRRKRQSGPIPSFDGMSLTIGI